MAHRRWLTRKREQTRDQNKPGQARKSQGWVAKTSFPLVAALAAALVPVGASAHSTGSTQAFTASHGASNATSTTASNAGNSWQPLGPMTANGITNFGDAGRVLSVATSKSTWYIGAAGGGVWKSVNHGQSWTPLTDKEPSLSASAIAIDKRHPQTIYVATGERTTYTDAMYSEGILKSTDGGKHWTVLGKSAFEGKYTSTIIIDNTNSQHLYVGASDGVYESKDGGHTWTLLPTHTVQQPVTALVMSPTNPKVLYAGIPGQGVFETTDGGQHWQELSLGVSPGNMDFVSLAVAPSDSQRLYAVISSLQERSLSGVYISRNGGKTWLKSQESLMLLGPSDDFAEFSTIGVDPRNENHVIFGANTFGESFDGGQTWQSLMTPHPDDHAITFDTQGDMLLGTDGGVWEETKDKTLVDLNNNLAITMFYPGASMTTDGKVLVAGSQDNGTFEYSAATHLWVQLVAGDGGPTAAIGNGGNARFLAQTLAESRLISITLSGGIGANATPKWTYKSLLPWVKPLAMVTASGKATLVVGGDRIYLSNNEGTSWKAISPSWQTTVWGTSHPDFITAVAIDKSNPHIIYAATVSGEYYGPGVVQQLRVTFDGGKHWQDVSPKIHTDGYQEITSITLNPANPDSVYLTYGGGTETPYTKPTVAAMVLYTANVKDKSAWQNLSGALPLVPTGSLAISGKTAFVGTQMGIYSASLGSSNWSSYHSGIPNVPVTSLLTFGNRLIAVTDGRGVWTTSVAQ